MAVKSARIWARSATAASCTVTNDRDQAIQAVFSPRSEGFTPLELQAAALVACIAASVLISAPPADIRVLRQIDGEVEAIKAEDEPSRLGRFEIVVHVADPLDDAVQNRLIEAAEDSCTISNTLSAGDTLVVGRAA